MKISTLSTHMTSKIIYHDTNQTIIHEIKTKNNKVNIQICTPDKLTLIVWYVVPHSSILGYSLITTYLHNQMVIK